MKIIKSNGSETTFSKSNIVNAISKANMRVRLEDRFTPDEIKQIAKDVEDHCKNEIRTMTSADIQNLVERSIMEAGKYDVAVAYITYRYQKQVDQRKNTTDERIYLSSMIPMKKLNRKTQIRILQFSTYRGITWLARYQRTYVNVTWFLVISGKLTRRELFIFMIVTILLIKNLTVISGMQKTCLKMELSCVV